ncbi:unnamed protein product, partial [Boreogadus saida]
TTTFSFPFWKTGEEPARTGGGGGGGEGGSSQRPTLALFNAFPGFSPDSLPCHVSAFPSFFLLPSLAPFVPFHATEDPEGSGFGREWVCRFVEPVIVLGSATKDSGVRGEEESTRDNRRGG